MRSDPYRFVRSAVALVCFTLPLEGLIVLPGIPRTSTVFGLAAGAGFVLMVASGARLKPSPPAFAVSFFLVGWALVSTVWSVNAGGTVGAVYDLARSVAIGWILFQASRNVGDLRGPARAAALGGTVAAVAVLSNLARGLPTEGSVDRFSAGVSDANLLALVLYSSAGLHFALGISSRHRVRWLSYGGAALCAMAALLTGSRGALVASTGSLIFVLIAIGGRRVRMIFAIAAAAACLAVAVINLAPETRYGRVLTGQESASALLAEEGFGSRPELGAIALQAWDESWAGGQGFGAFPTYSEERGHRPLVAHSVYLGLLAELGLVGVLLFLLIWLLAGSSVLRAPPPIRATLIGLCSLWLLMAAFITLEYDPALWLLLGAVSVAAQSRQGDLPMSTADLIRAGSTELEAGR